jgi:CRISPR/Cas system CSM-associated protein Csm2 small subunit
MTAYEIVKKRLDAIKRDIAEMETHAYSANAQFVQFQSMLAEYLEQLLREISDNDNTGD